MIRERDYPILELMTKLQMSDHRNRPCELYIETLPTVQSESISYAQDISGRFEILVFEYESEKHNHYVRYPNFPHFIEMYDSGMSSQGTMSNGGLRNVISEQVNPRTFEGVQQQDNIRMFRHEHSAMISQGSLQINFLTRVAQQGHYKNGDYGKDFLDRAFGRKYVPMPDLRNIEYAYKTEQGHIIIVNSSAFNYSYDDIVLQYGAPAHGFMTAKISEFARYRDGGTTNFIATLMDGPHKFHSPTSFKPEEVATWDGRPLTKLTDEEIDRYAKLLNINRAPKTERN